MLTASNKKHARLRMNEWIFYFFMDGFSKLKVLLFTTQKLTFTVAFVTFGDVIKYQNNSSCCQFRQHWAEAGIVVFALTRFAQKFARSQNACMLPVVTKQFSRMICSFKNEEKKKRSKKSERKDRSTVRDIVPLAVTSRSPQRTHFRALPLYPACLITLTTLPIWYTPPPPSLFPPIPSSFLFLFFNHKVTRKVSPVRQAFSFNDTEKSGEALGSPAGERGVSTCACILSCPSVCRWSKWLDPVSGLINERPVRSGTSYQSRH